MGLVWQRLPASVRLAGLVLGISVVLALPIGVLAAVMKDTPFDFLAKMIALLGWSLPSFWLGIVLMWIFAVHYRKRQARAGGGDLRHQLVDRLTRWWPAGCRLAADARAVRIRRDSDRAPLQHVWRGRR